MKVDGYTIISGLSVANLAEVFRRTTEGMYGGKAKLGAGLRRLSGQVPTGQRLEFFTPKDDSPFASLETDQPQFSVGVSIPKFVGSGGGIVLQAFIWDRGPHRETKIVTPYTVGSSSSSKTALAKLADAYRDADTSARVTQA